MREWRYTNGNDTIRIFLRYHRERSIESKRIIDRLWGYYEYKHGTTIVSTSYPDRYENLPYLTDDFPFHTGQIFLGFYVPCNVAANVLGGFMSYDMKGTQYYGITATLDPTGTQLTWHQEFTRSYRTDISVPSNPPVGADKMPDDFILIKQP